MIIIIHGLNGHELKTWKKKEGLSILELFSQGTDFREFAIYSFGYCAGFFLKQYNVEAILRLLVIEMKNRLNGKHSTYLITHS
ncbi:hypothetical protein P5792_24805 [Bacillus toyonensis]|nr:hypothetical protein [Bacillus toyonensis]